MPNPYAHAWRTLQAEARRIYAPVCHLCHVDIDETLPRTDPYSWTLDHLDPVAHHGAAVPGLDRVRPAHRRCNSRRGKRPVEASPRSETW